jgi:anti-sigma regulatory factor (Ser/Thr protein kinase)
VSPEPGLPAAAGSPDATGAGPPQPRELLDQPFERDSLVALRNAVAAHASRLGVGDDLVEHVVLVAYELASNAVRHGEGHGRLRLHASEGVIGCTVTDEGGGFPDAEHAGLTRPEPTASGGRGLWLVRCLADTVEIRSDGKGTTVDARFAIR